MPVLSLRTYIGIGLALAFLLLVAHDRRVDHLRHEWKQKTLTLVGITAEVAGQPKMNVKDAPAAIRRIGADRDTYFRNWQLAKGALLDQTQRVVALGEETKRLREQADRQQALVAQLKAQRDGWIKRAQAASTRTQRLSDRQEAAQCEEAMNALYRAGF